MQKKAGSLSLLLIVCVIIGLLLFFQLKKEEKNIKKLNDIQFSKDLTSITDIYFEQCLDYAYENTVITNGFEKKDIISEGDLTSTNSFDYYFSIYFKNCLNGVYSYLEERGYKIETGKFDLKSQITNSFIEVIVSYPHTFERKGTIERFSNIEKLYPKSIIANLENPLENNLTLQFPDKVSYLTIPKNTKILDIDGKEVKEISISISKRNIFDLENDNVIGEIIYNISPDVFFTEPVELTLSFPVSNNLDNDSSYSSRIGWLNEKVNIWMMQNTTVQKKGDYYEAKAKINHASIWAILSGPCGSSSEKIQLDEGGKFDFGRYSADCISTEMNPQEQKCVLNGKYDNYFYFEEDGTLNQPLSCDISGLPGSIIRKLKCSEGEIDYVGAEFFEVPPYDRENYLYDKIIRDSSCEDKVLIKVNGIEEEADGYTSVICAGGYIESNENLPYTRRYVFPNNGDACINDYPGAILTENIDDVDDNIELVDENLKSLNLIGVIEGCSEGDYFSTFNNDRFQLCKNTGECREYNTLDEKTKKILMKKKPGYFDWLNSIKIELAKDIQLSEQDKESIISFIDTGEIDDELRNRLEKRKSLCNSNEAFHVLSDYNEYGDALAIDLERLEVINDHSFDMEHADLKASIENYYFELQNSVNPFDSQRVCFVKGTKIDTPNGSKNIENLVVGDYVLSYSIDSRKLEMQKVEETYIRKTRKIVHLNLDNGIELNVTPDHPFYDGAQFKPISEFRKGESLFSIEGNLVTIADISENEIPETEVYNLKVAKNNNYFANGILVHNQGYENALQCLFDGSDDQLGLAELFDESKEEIETKVSIDFPGFSFDGAKMGFCSVDCLPCFSNPEENQLLCNHILCKAYEAGQHCLALVNEGKHVFSCGAAGTDFDLTVKHEMTHNAQHIIMERNVEALKNYKTDQRKYHNKLYGNEEKIESECADPRETFTEGYADYVSGADGYYMTWPGEDRLEYISSVEWFLKIQETCPEINAYSVGANPIDKNIEEFFDCCSAKLGISECWHRFRMNCPDCYSDECGPEDVSK